MSTLHVQQSTGTHLDPSEQRRRRADLDHDLVAIVAMLAILGLTALCLLGQSLLPL